MGARATWAIYGFALSYGYTQNKHYLDAAVKLARKLSNNWTPSGAHVGFRLPAMRTCP